MTVRPLSPEDLPVLEALAKQSGHPYPALAGSHIEAVQVVVDDQGQIVMAAAAERITQLYLFAGSGHPATKLNAIRMLHESMASELRKLGYNESNIFIPECLIQSFGRRLQQMFGWRWNWKSLYLKF